jgi:hypothetical protein
MNIALNKGELAKLVTLLAIVTTLTVFSQYKISMAVVPVGFATIPADLLDKVSVTSFNGNVQTAVTNSESYVMSVPDTISSWDAATGVTVSHSNVASAGCANVFTDNINVNFTVTNELIASVRGAINISVYNSKTGVFMDDKVLMLTFTVGQPAFAAAKFSLTTADLQPIFLVKVTFPTGQDAESVTSTKQVSLFEFLLMRAGILAR